MPAEFIRAEDNDPAKAETWTLAHDHAEGSHRFTVGWRKGSRWVAIDDPDGTTKVFPLSETEMRALAEIASTI